MATYNNTWRNKAWMGWFLMQVPVIFCRSALHPALARTGTTADAPQVVDLLEFLWPAWAYEPAGAPLHAAFALKQWYIQKYNDPVVQWSPATAAGHDSWMGLFLYLEFAFLLPTVLYGVYRLAVQRRGTSGADELLFLVYALEVAFTTLVCIYDTLYWDPAVHPAELKREMQVQLYGPWLVVRKCPPRDAVICSPAHHDPAAIGAIDMATRILGRIRVADAALGAKKAQ